MTKTKWTPGRWSAKPVRDGYEAAIDAPDWQELATVYGRDPDDDMPDGRWNREGQANARLIAAAPDLYRELHRLVSLLAAKGEHDMDIPGLATLNGPRAALNKAVGND